MSQERRLWIINFEYVPELERDSTVVKLMSTISGKRIIRCRKCGQIIDEDEKVFPCGFATQSKDAVLRVAFCSERCIDEFNEIMQADESKLYHLLADNFAQALASLYQNHLEQEAK